MRTTVGELTVDNLQGHIDHAFVLCDTNATIRSVAFSSRIQAFFDQEDTCGQGLLRGKVKVAQLCPTLCHSMDYPWNSPDQNTGVGSLSLLQGIFPTQGSNPGLLHWRRILYQLSHKRSPRILEWVAYSFSSGSSQVRANYIIVSTK